MAVAYLEKLNSEQRRAVEHGVRDNACAPSVPLLVIAGAGSGKTNTLAHRVAHLVVNGADPRRILLMTFSRRASAAARQRVPYGRKGAAAGYFAIERKPESATNGRVGVTYRSPGIMYGLPGRQAVELDMKTWIGY
jgi:hypothetical protein